MVESSVGSWLTVCARVCSSSAHRLLGHLAQLLAQAQLLQVAVDGLQPPLAVGRLLLQTHQGDVQGLAAGHHLVDRVLQLPDHVGVVRLELPVLQISNVSRRES